MQNIVPNASENCNAARDCGDRYMWWKKLKTHPGVPKPVLQLASRITLDWADAQTGEFFYSQATMAARLGVTRQTINTHVRWLIRNGWLRTYWKPGYRQLHYALTIPGAAANVIVLPEQTFRSKDKAVVGKTRHQVSKSHDTNIVREHRAPLNSHSEPLGGMSPPKVFGIETLSVAERETAISQAIKAGLDHAGAVHHLTRFVLLKKTTPAAQPDMWAEWVATDAALHKANIKAKRDRLAASRKMAI